MASRRVFEQLFPESTDDAERGGVDSVAVRGPPWTFQARSGPERVFVKEGSGGDSRAERSWLECELQGLQHARAVLLGSLSKHGEHDGTSSSVEGGVTSSGARLSVDECEELLARASRPQAVLRDRWTEFNGVGKQSVLNVPRPWMVGETSPGQYFIAMDALELSRGDSTLGRELGLGLAELHEGPACHSTFGFPVDGCCGAAPQPNNSDGRDLDWVAFWSEFRLGAQLELARKQTPSDMKLLELGAQLQKRLPELFSMLHVEDIKLSMLHGDLWSGNYSADSRGNPVIYDPAGYYGHSEADLGIARMFGGFPDSFWTAYHERVPKLEGFDRRAVLYELHHHLNHLNIFGSGYRGGCISKMEQLLEKRHF